ncbi:HNH endonuclease signature motif containing protein [Enterobacter asburiae]|uniref:HNH endonuclease signature motif containing protein n=1 Tax=Enterobacter asburiae TaxID=61645 RepID=UPI0018C25597|nr:HNH endonuclease signature motif containing protein [Enterobacter asburiae]MBF9773382.1 HNH endonuclease [Enterobacter asburiae]
MAKKRKAKNNITPEQIAARKLEEQRHKQADEVMANLKIEKGQYLGVSIWKNISIQLARGKNVAEITYDMERDTLVGQSRTMEIKRLRAKEHQQQSRDSVDKIGSSPAAPAPVKNRPKPGKLRTKTLHLLKKKPASSKVDAWTIARDASRSSAPQKKLTFGAILHQNPVAKPEAASFSVSEKPLKGVNTPAITIKSYGLPLPKPKASTTKGKLKGIEKAMKMVPISSRREFAMFVHKHRESGHTAEQLLAQYQAAAIAAPAANDSAVVAPEFINETAPVQLTGSMQVTHDPFKEERVQLEQLVNKLEARFPNFRQTLENTAVTPEYMEELDVRDITAANPLRDGRELRGDSCERLVRQRDAAIQAEFKAELCYNFGYRCAVSGKHLGGILDAAHIESAVEGDYSVSNGILLSPTLHRLFDANKMGINPETMTVHFKPGIEFEEYEGRLITPLHYRLNKEKLAARWGEYLRDAH